MIKTCIKANSVLHSEIPISQTFIFLNGIPYRLPCSTGTAFYYSLYFSETFCISDKIDQTPKRGICNLTV